mgnify:CR=1 FL=1
MIFFFQAEDGIRDLVRSRGLGDVYKRQERRIPDHDDKYRKGKCPRGIEKGFPESFRWGRQTCLLYTSDAADERSSVDLGGRRIIKKKKQHSVKVG